MWKITLFLSTKFEVGNFMNERMTPSQRARTVAAHSLFILLAACGGGRGSPQSPSVSSQQAVQAQSTIAAAATTTAGTATSPTSQTAKTNSVVIAPVTTPSVVAASAAMPGVVYIKGVNLSGAEYNQGNPSAHMGWDYIYPSTAEIDYYHRKGFTTIRLPIAGSRVQPQNNAPLNSVEIAYIQSVVAYCAGYNMSVILDPHDYGMKYDAISGTMLPLGMDGGLPASDFADFWGRMAQVFRSAPNVIFGLMNEPHLQSAMQWQAVAEAGIASIRAAGATQLILIPGTNYTGAHDWVTSGNAAAWQTVSDPANNFAFEMHQYLDSDDSGTHATCVQGKGATVLSDATQWARSMGYRLFLGEVGWSQDPSCVDEGPAIMNYTSTNSDVWIGWTYWAGGSWIPQSYPFMLDPADFSNPVDQPQMAVLVANL